MKFIIDENVPQLLIRFLRTRKHQILDIKNSKYARSSDQEIAHISIKRRCIIITFDKDFLGLNKRQRGLKCIILNLKTINQFYLQS